MTDVLLDVRSTITEALPSENTEDCTSYLHVSMRQYENIPIIVARGDLDLGSVSVLWAVLESCIANRAGDISGSHDGGDKHDDAESSADANNGQASDDSIGTIAIDLREVTFIDSAGLVLLVEARRRFAQTSHFALLIQSNTQPERVIKLARFETFFPILRTVEELKTIASDINKQERYRQAY